METKAHKVSEVLHQDVFYPAHPPRTESEAYKTIHHRLVVEEDRPCEVCGLRNSDLSNPSVNIHHVREIETHHMVVEWALANLVDKEKLEFLLGHSVEDVDSWVDHDAENLIVLCDRHHRHREVGIHELSYPIWVAQKVVKDALTTGDGQ